MLNSTNVGDGDYFPTFWQEDIHCRFSHATIAAMCSPLYLIWLGFTMSVVVLSQKQKGLDSMQGVQPFLRLCVGRSRQLQLSAEQKQIDAKDNGCYQGMVTSLQICGNDVSCAW